MKKFLFLITIFLIMSFNLCYAVSYINYEECSVSGSNTEILEYIIEQFNLIPIGFNETYTPPSSQAYNDFMEVFDNYSSFVLSVYVNTSDKLNLVLGCTNNETGLLTNYFSDTSFIVLKPCYSFTLGNQSINGTTSCQYQYRRTQNYQTGIGSPELYRLAKYGGKFYQSTDSDFNIETMNSPTFSANGTPSSVQYFDGTIYNLNVDYSISGKQLGQIENNQYGSNYFATLYQVQLNDNVVVRYGKVCDSTNGNDLYINNTGIDIGNHGFISLPSRFLASGKFYELNITYTSVGGSSKYINTYFYINGSTSGSGDLIVRSGDSYGSLIDLTETNIIANNQNDNTANIIDTINDVSSYNSGDIATIIDNTFDTSGEFFGFLSEWGSGDGVNYYNFLYDFFQSLLTTLTSTGEVILPITYRDYTINLSSNAFIIADNPIKTFAKLFLITGFVFLIFQDLNKQYKHIREFNVYSVLHDTDVDYNMFL